MFGWLKNLFVKKPKQLKNYPECVFPLPILPDGRKGVVTSSSKWRNKSRPNHDGDDWVYPRAESDTEGVGDGAGSRNMKWNVPQGSVCVAVREGIVREKQFGGIKTGFRCYVQHEDGYRSGYFHLKEILVNAGDYVKAGQPIGIIGHNPSAIDILHLHFEISEGVDYRPIDPWKYLKKHGAVHAEERKEWLL